MKLDHVLQFRIALDGIRPPIWRRLVMPCTATFWDLHVAIQDVMGWDDRHEHAFVATVPIVRAEIVLGIPIEDEEHELAPFIPGWEVPIAAFFTVHSRRGNYVYGGGDGWSFTLRLERIMPSDPGQEYPQCIGGRRASPPEGCGNIARYRDLLATVADPHHPHRRGARAVLGADFDPNHFDCKTIAFSDPEDCLDTRLDDLELLEDLDPCPEPPPPPPLRVIPGGTDDTTLH